MPKKYPDSIYRRIRPSIPGNLTDEQKDNFIDNHMNPNEVFTACLEHEGIGKYDATIRFFIESVYGIKFDLYGKLLY